MKGHQWAFHIPGPPELDAGRSRDPDAALRFQSPSLPQRSASYAPLGAAPLREEPAVTGYPKPASTGGLERRLPREFPYVRGLATLDPEGLDPAALRKPRDPEAPPGAYGPDYTLPLTLQTFLTLNPNLRVLKEARDEMLGWKRYLAAVIFAFTLFFPILGMLTNLRRFGWLIVLIWVPLGMIMVFWMEYRCRSEVWFMCLCRGIIVDFRKTENVKQWALHPAMFLAYLFLLVCGAIVGAGSTDKSAWQRIVIGVLFSLGMVFVIFLVKGFIDLEGAPRLLSVNMMLFYFHNPRLLRAKGFKVVHYTQLAEYLKKQRTSPDSFTWNQLYAMTEEPLATKPTFFWGSRGRHFLTAVKDADR